MAVCLMYVIPQIPQSKWARPPVPYLRFTVLKGAESYKRGLLDQDKSVHSFAFFLLILCQILPRSAPTCPSNISVPTKIIQSLNSSFLGSATC